MEVIMTLVAIVGSPRKKGNTEVLVDRILEGFSGKAPDVEVEKIRIADLTIEPCRGTLACRKTGVCVIQDDMQPLLEKIKRADGIIIGSPVYRRHLPGQTKVFMVPTGLALVAA